MYKASFIVHSQAFKNNRIFSRDPEIARDDAGLPFYLLRQRLLEKGIDLATEDIHPPCNSALSISMNIHDLSFVKNTRGKKYLIINEPPCTSPKNWNRKYHTVFDRIFTYNDTWVDNEKYFLLRFPNNYGYGPLKEPPFEEKKFCTMIVGFKRSNHPNELYSERLCAIRWFAENHPDEFDLYGFGWPGSFRPCFNRYLEKYMPGAVNSFLDLFFPQNPVYKGTVGSKRKALSRYRFSICYENCHSETGYITEKLFDSMSAGCVPVYWGADNVSSLIPEECFINRQSFEEYDGLYKYLKSINKEKHAEYQDNIQKFVESVTAEIFMPLKFTDTISSFAAKDMDYISGQQCI